MLFVITSPHTGSCTFLTMLHTVFIKAGARKTGSQWVNEYFYSMWIIWWPVSATYSFYFSVWQLLNFFGCQLFIFVSIECTEVISVGWHTMQIRREDLGYICSQRICVCGWKSAFADSAAIKTSSCGCIIHRSSSFINRTQQYSNVAYPSKQNR